MTKQISSYKELLEEKARLKTVMAEQQVLIKQDWQLIKEDLKPAVLVVTTMRNLLTRKAGMGAAQLGVNIVADGLIKKVLLAQTGWFTRWLIPFLVKNYASHVVGEPEKFMHKVKAFFGKREKMDQETGMDAV
jgi:hypothetical protein